MFTGSLERAILETLVYSDIFDYPLRLDELHRYLTVRVEFDELKSTLHTLRDSLGRAQEFYFLRGREQIVETRRQREARSRTLLPIALSYGRLLGSLPFVRMVALTGSLAVMNVSKNADFDYMLVAAKGRVWTARAFSLVLNRVAGFLGHTLCPNLIVSETALKWPLHDLYSARELFQMIPITGMKVYQGVIKANQWAEEFLPNASMSLRRVADGSDEATPALPGTCAWGRCAPGASVSDSIMNSLFEFPLGGKLGDNFELWEMTRKIDRFSKQEGFGEETVFSAEVCQGNFHHHRKWTHDIFRKRLHEISNGSPLPLGEGVGVRVQ